MGKLTLHDILSFNIDTQLNPYIPPFPLHALPQSLRHFLGHRSANPPADPPPLIQWLLTFLATLAGLCLVGGIYSTAPAITTLNPPTMIAALGASAVLDYNAICSPLAQPRNAIIGHTLSAVVGVGISKLFQLDPAFFTDYGWVVGAVGCACASLLMSATGTVHPPGGATAVLACTEMAIVGLGWMFVPLVVLASVLMTMVACLFNNLGRRYPVYWWTAEDVGGKWKGKREGKGDLNKLEMQVSETDSERTLQHAFSHTLDDNDGLREIRILPGRIRLPLHIGVTEEEIAVLRNLQNRLRAHDELER